LSLIAFLGTIETGLIFGLVALGVYLSFRILQFPDLTVDGSFPLGAAVSAVLIVGAGVNPFLATLVGCVAGAAAGLMTAWLNVRLKILHLLASILTMIALYSINLRIMGRPNIALLGETTVFSPLDALGISTYAAVPAALFVLVVAAKLAMDWFLSSEVGLAMRATGANARMARAQGINTDFYTLLGMAISNALVAGRRPLGRAGTADVTKGSASSWSDSPPTTAASGDPAALIFLATWPALPARSSTRLAVALALNAEFIGLKAQDLNLITALLVAAAMVLPSVRAPVKRALKGDTRVVGPLK